MKYYLNGREVIDIATEGTHDELFVIDAYYADSVEMLTDEECYDLYAIYFSELSTDAFIRAIDSTMDSMDIILDY